MIRLYRQGLIPQTALALESALASYRSGKTPMQQVLANLTAQLDYETSAIRQLADYQSALVRLEILTGTTLQSIANQPTKSQAREDAQ